jgi:hypothetical protein
MAFFRIFPANILDLHYSTSPSVCVKFQKFFLHMIEHS